MKYEYLHFKVLKLPSALRFPRLMSDITTFYETCISCYFDIANPPNQTFDYMNNLNCTTKANDPNKYTSLLILYVCSLRRPIKISVTDSRQDLH